MERELYSVHFGGWSTHTQQPYHHVFKIPDGMDIANIPPIMCAGITVFNPLKRHAGNNPGARLGVMGIGGLGHLAIQYGKALGLNVTAITTQEDKADLCKLLGASAVIVVDKNFKELDKHRNKFDYLINLISIGNLQMFEAYLNTLVNGGTFIQIAMPDIHETFQATFATIVTKQIKIVGSYICSISEMKSTLEFTKEHNIRVWAEEHKFEDFPKALKRVEDEKPHFRGVVNCKDYSDKHFPNPLNNIVPMKDNIVNNLSNPNTNLNESRPITKPSTEAVDTTVNTKQGKCCEKNCGPSNCDSQASTELKNHHETQ